MIKAVFFDLDGTLLPIDEDKFTKAYFELMCEKMVKYGYKKEELINVIWSGTMAMYKNDGSKTNKEVFWDHAKSVYGDKIIEDMPLFDEFYVNEFKKLKQICGENKLAKEIINFCKNNVEFTILSTNPIFPADGTKTRMGFIGVNEKDFDFVTYYENSNYCKPNPKYFLELLKRFNLKPEEVILFGNNTLEDGECALLAGIKCYLVEGNIIYNPKSTHEFEKISMENVIYTIKNHI